MRFSTTYEIRGNPALGSAIYDSLYIVSTDSTPGVRDFFVELDGGGQYHIAYPASSADTQPYTQPMSSLQLEYGDYNADGIRDLMIKGLETANPGHHDVIVYASEGSNSNPEGIVEVDEAFSTVFTELAGHLNNPTDIFSNGPITYETLYVLDHSLVEQLMWVGLFNIVTGAATECNDHNLGGRAWVWDDQFSVNNCFDITVEPFSGPYDPGGGIYHPITFALPDFEYFNEDALVIWSYLMAGDLVGAAIELMGILKVPVFGDILADTNIPIDYPADVNDPSSISYVIFEVWDRIREILNDTYQYDAAGVVFSAENSAVIVQPPAGGGDHQTGDLIELECHTPIEPWVYVGYCPTVLWSWDFGDGNTLLPNIANRSVVHTYDDPGLYTAQCTAQCAGIPGTALPVFTQVAVAEAPPQVTFLEDENQKYGFHRDYSIPNTFWKSLKAGDTDTVKLTVVPNSAISQLDLSADPGLSASPQNLSQIPEIITVDDLNGQSGQLNVLYDNQTIENLNVQVYTEREITVAYRRVDALPGTGYPGFVSGDITGGEAVEFEQEIQRIWSRAVVDVNFVKLDPCEVGGIDVDWNTFVPVNLSEGPPTQEQINVINICRSTVPTHDFTIFLVNVDNVPGMPGGSASFNLGVAFIHMTESFDRARTTAHEIGHMLSNLPDVLSPMDNLMVSGGFGKELTNEQWDAVHQ